MSKIPMEIKEGAVLVMEGLMITVRLRNHGSADGTAELAFNEENVSLEPLEESNKHIYLLQLDNSELLELRDFLNKHFPEKKS